MQKEWPLGVSPPACPRPGGCLAGSPDRWAERPQARLLPVTIHTPLLICLLLLCTSMGLAQSITLTVKEAPMEQVFPLIEQQS